MSKDEKAQLVQPPIPTGGIYEALRPLSPHTTVPGTAGTAAPDAAAATAAAVSVEPGLQEAILQLLPQWKPLLERVDALEKAQKDMPPQLSPDFLDDFSKVKEAIEKRVADLQGIVGGYAREEEPTRAAVKLMGERLDALAEIVNELREELGVEDDSGPTLQGAKPPKGERK